MRVNGALQECWPSIGDECADMTVIHGDVYSKPREAERLDLRGIKRKKEGKWKKHLMFLLNSIKDKKIAKVYMNEWGQFIHLSLCLYRSCPLCMISPEQCTYYVNWQCLLTWLAHVQHLFKQPTYTTKHPDPTKTQTHRKVHVLIEPAHPLPLLQTIPAVFVYQCTFLFLNAERISDQSHTKKTHMRSYMQAQNSAVNTRLLRN